MLGLSHVGTYLCLWPTTATACYPWRLWTLAAPMSLGSSHIFQAAPMFSENEIISPHGSSVGHSQGREGDCQLPHAKRGCKHRKYKRRSRRATVTLGPGLPLLCGAVLQTDSVPWEYAAPVLTSVIWPGHCKTSKSPKHESSEANRRARWRFPTSSDQSCAHWVEGSQGAQ